jgi:oligopeptide transport system ATP-binding protein
MYLGRIVETGRDTEIYDHPTHPYTQARLSAVPVPDPEARDRRERIILTGAVPSPANIPSGCRFRTRCAFAQEVCAAERPPMRAFGDAGTHRAACHFPLRPPTGDTAPPSAPTRV